MIVELLQKHSGGGRKGAILAEHSRDGYGCNATQMAVQQR